MQYKGQSSHQGKPDISKHLEIAKLHKFYITAMHSYRTHFGEKMNIHFKKMTDLKMFLTTLNERVEVC